MRLFHGTNIDFKEIDFQKCNSQYFFGTEKAISKLKRIWH